MTVEMPLYLKQLEPLPSALDIMRFFYKRNNQPADTVDVCEGLGISERRFSKAIRRLITNNYLQMLSNYTYELTRKGMQAARELAEYDANAPADTGIPDGKTARQLVIALPRLVVARQANPLHLGFAPASSSFTTADVIVRCTALHAAVSATDTMLKLGSSSYAHSLTLTPEAYTQIRLRVQVFQLSEFGDDLLNCGGMHVDVDVVRDGGKHPLVAYETRVLFNA